MKSIFYHFLILQILLISSQLFSQKDDAYDLKSEAIRLMSDQRYGEAIDQLNKFVSANPNIADGFNLRGTCYEKRGNYEYAVYDFRTAKKLKPGDNEIVSNLNRTTNNWYKLLYNKIEGHKREIAINSSIAKNYLEIGKCYKNLGEWNEAEIWYDLYLEKEFASSDEIIRYSEILAKNNHIAKGEPVLKTYTEKFSNDHRIWSRYGYFTLWLGKNKNAIDAFAKSLEIRPYFKEAMDGLDIAKGKGYVYSVNDTSARFNYGMPTTTQEYAIDKFYRQLKKNPEKDEIRFKLIDELIKANRYEEAYDQLKILSPKFSETDKFKDLWLKVTTLRKSYYADRISYYENLLSKNPKDKKALLELARYYSYNNDYDLAVKLYKSYLENYPEDNEVRYQLAQILMWQNNLCEAAEIMSNVVINNPENEKYLLLAAKINLWLDKDSDYTQSLYQKVLLKDPTNKEAMFGMANLLIKSNNLLEAKKTMDDLAIVDSLSDEYRLIKNNYLFVVEQNGLKESYNLLEDARKYSSQKQFDLSIQKFKSYLNKNSENKNVNIELADVYIANDQLNDAENIYKSLLKSGEDYEISKRLAKIYLWDKDSIAAVNEFKKLNQKNPQDVETKLLLGDAYLLAGQTQNARTIYEELILKSPDSYILQKRMNWLGGSNKFSFERFPTFIQLIPRGLYFADNTGLDYSNYGLGFDLGVTNFLTLGFSGARGKLSSEMESLRFNQLKGSAFIKISEIFSAAGAFGQTFFMDDNKENLFEFSLSAQKKNIYNVIAYLNYSDAAFMLYSPYLVNTRLTANHFGLNGEYIFRNSLIVSGKYSYLSVSDENYGNQFVARLGKIFNSEITAGYEYYFYTFNNQTNLYWSPKNFEAHSIWADWILYEDEVVDFTIGGKVGLIPNDDFVLSEFYAAFNYKIVQSLFLQTKFATSSSYRSGSGYRANSIQASIIWSL
jgi:Flp pilus assembly protein TadD